MVYQNSSHVWIGTDGGGLYDYDLTTNKFRNYTTQESLPSNAVYGLIKILLWIKKTAWVQRILLIYQIAAMRSSYCDTALIL